MKSDLEQGFVVEKCPLCKVESDTMVSEIVLQNNDADVMHVTCGRCKYAFLFFHVRSEMGHVSLGTVTDLSLEESQRFLHENPITHEDAFALYQKVVIS